MHTKTVSNHWITTRNDWRSVYWDWSLFKMP